MKKRLKIVSFIILFILPLVADDTTKTEAPSAREDLTDIVDENIKYTINLMWINSKLREDQDLICPDNQPCLSQIFSWATKNPESKVDFWFDSEKTTDEQVKKTRKLMQSGHTTSMAPIALRDIRDLPEVKENTKIFSDTRIPVYFRADLLRAIAGFNVIAQKDTDHFVYADLDMNAISKKELFNRKTQQDLQQYGMVLA